MSKKRPLKFGKERGPAKPRYWKETPESWAPTPGVEPLALLDIAPRGQCRWPASPDARLYCAAPTKPGRSYCDAHHARAFR